MLGEVLKGCKRFVRFCLAWSGQVVYKDGYGEMDI